MDNDEVLPQDAQEILTPEAISLIKGEGYHLTKEIAAIKVTNETAYVKAVELGTANKKVLNQIESFRKAIVKPFNDQIKNINSMFKKISEKFEINDAKIRKAIETYQNSRKKTETIQNVNTEVGRATIQERFDYDILNADLVPREWCCPDVTRIGRAVRSGAISEIPGVKIFKRKVTAFVAA